MIESISDNNKTKCSHDLKCVEEEIFFLLKAATATDFQIQGTVEGILTSCITDSDASRTAATHKDLRQVVKAAGWIIRQELPNLDRKNASR